MAAGLFCFCSSTFQFGTVSYFGPVDSKLPFMVKLRFSTVFVIFGGVANLPLCFSVYIWNCLSDRQLFEFGVLWGWRYFDSPQPPTRPNWLSYF